MTKKNKSYKSMFVVVSTGGIKSFETFEEAESYAIDEKERNETEDYYILEVVKAWEVDFPEEPSPIVYKRELWDLP